MARSTASHHPEEDASGVVLRSQVACAVLGLVIERPSHGYEISQRFEARFTSFLSVGRSAIYGALSSLGRCWPDREDGGSLSDEFAAWCESGRVLSGDCGLGVGVCQWLALRVRNDPQRVEMLGRLAGAGVRGIDGALDFIASYERECLQEAKELARPEQRPSRQKPI